jgi:hypothetical protein
MVGVAEEPNGKGLLRVVNVVSTYYLVGANFQNSFVHNQTLAAVTGAPETACSFALCCNCGTAI